MLFGNGSNDSTISEGRSVGCPLHPSSLIPAGVPVLASLTIPMFGGSSSWAEQL